MDMTDNDYKEELSKIVLRAKRHSETRSINTHRPDTLYASVDEEDEDDDKVSDSREDADCSVNADADSNADAGTESDEDAGADTDEDAVSNEDENADSDDGVDAYASSDGDVDSDKDSDEDADADKDSDEDTNTDAAENADTDSATDEDSDADTNTNEDWDDTFVLEADISAFMQRVNQMGPLIVEGNDDGDYDMIRPNLNKTTDPYVLRANITAFVQRIKQMAPLVDDIELRPRPYLLYEKCTDLYGSLVTQLFQLSKHVTYNDRELFPVPLKLQPNQICDLEEIGDFTHLYFGTKSDQSPFVQLAQRSVLTLRSLRIGHSSYSGLGDFILDTKGGYVSYPHMLTLSLVRTDNADSAEYPTLPGAVPFPNLRHLLMDITYPFTDDMLFRGNAATLEHLKMRMDYHSYNTVSKHNV
ncbi:hypothetical protein H4S07_003975, partial [Coemansia furcata]